MTHFEYIIATSGYVHCACLECFDTAIGGLEAFCGLCEEACCDGESGCQRDDVYEEC